MNSGAVTVQAKIVIASRVALLETLSFHFANLVCDSVKQNNNTKGLCPFESPRRIQRFVGQGKSFADGENEGLLLCKVVESNYCY